MISAIDEVKIYVKCCKVIDSCTNISQVLVAIKFIGRARRQLDSFGFNDLRSRTETARLRVLGITRMKS